MKKIIAGIILVIGIVNFLSCNKSIQEKNKISIKKIPDTSVINSNYVSNRAPLKKSVFVKLPLGSVTPEGWLKTTLERKTGGWLKVKFR